MSKIVKYTQFKNVVDALWNKIKINFITEVEYDSNNKKLKYTKNGVEQEITKIVTEWQDLEHTTQSSIKNIFDKNTQVEEDKIYSFNSISPDTNWKIIKIPCKAGDEFTIIKSANNDSSQIGIYDENKTHLRRIDATHTQENGKRVYRLTIPNDLQNASYFVNSMHNDTTNINEVMVFKENVVSNNIPTNYVPFSDGATVFIDSSEVALSFDGTGTSLSSATIHSAIKELDGKVGNAGGGGTVTSVNNQNPDPQGNVTIGIADIQGLQGQLDGKIDKTQIGTTNGMIPQIGINNKLATSIMPDLAITSVTVVADKQGAMNLITNGTIQVGDVVVIESDNNSVHMYNGKTNKPFEQSFIELSLGEGTIKVINNQRPDSTGSLTLNGTQINVNGQSNTTIQQEFDKCVKSVNGVTPISGTGEVTIFAGQINGTYNQSGGTVQSHLNTIKTEINSNLNRIARLESRLPSHVVGEFMVCYDKGDSFTTKDGAVFLHLNGQLVQHRNYPDLASALGITTTVNSYYIPRINDITDRFDNSSRNAVRKHYVCAKA